MNSNLNFCGIEFCTMSQARVLFIIVFVLFSLFYLFETITIFFCNIFDATCGYPGEGPSRLNIYLDTYNLLCKIVDHPFPNTMQNTINNLRMLIIEQRVLDQNPVDPLAILQRITINDDTLFNNDVFNIAYNDALSQLLPSLDPIALLDLNDVEKKKLFSQHLQIVTMRLFSNQDDRDWIFSSLIQRSFRELLKLCTNDEYLLSCVEDLRRDKDEEAHIGRKDIAQLAPEYPSDYEVLGDTPIGDLKNEIKSKRELNVDLASAFDVSIDKSNKNVVTSVPEDTQCSSSSSSKTHRKEQEQNKKRTSEKEKK